MKANSADPDLKGAVLSGSTLLVSSFVGIAPAMVHVCSNVTYKLEIQCVRKFRKQKVFGTWFDMALLYVGLVPIRPVYGVSDQVMHILPCLCDRD